MLNKLLTAKFAKSPGLKPLVGGTIFTGLKARAPSDAQNSVSFRSLVKPGRWHHFHGPEELLK
jgi:hypothetical protein